MAQRRRRRRREKFGFRHILALLAGVAILAAAAYLIVTNYLLVVRGVSVQLPEDCRYTPQQAAQLAQIKLGTRMDRVDEEAISRALASTGWLYLEDIVLDYPDQVQLVVGQRKPAALVSHVSTLIVTDSDGVVIEQVSGDPGYPDCVYVTDVDVRRAQPGEALAAATAGRVEAMTALLQGLQEVPCQDLISWATMENPRGVCLYSVNHVWVEMGEPENMADKLRWTEAALTDLIARDAVMGTLSVVSGTHADYAPPQ